MSPFLVCRREELITFCTNLGKICATEFQPSQTRKKERRLRRQLACGFVGSWKGGTRLRIKFLEVFAQNIAKSSRRLPHVFCVVFPACKTILSFRARRDWLTEPAGTQDLSTTATLPSCRTSAGDWRPTSQQEVAACAWTPRSLLLSYTA